MEKISKFIRPTFGEAVAAWKAALSQRALPTDLIWIFDENLCYEENPAAPGKLKLGFQTRFAPPPADAEHIAYDYFAGFEAPVVFYRIGSCDGKSVCALLCDVWFQSKGEAEGFHRRDDWLIAFRPGGAEPVEEITDLQRWKQRLVRDRPLQDLDFAMSLRAVHEMLAHGRVLTAYEHYALRLFQAWRRLLTRTN
jgi:hypothetical protein